jgi:aspartate/methionine/tyrosine aminotransferase
MMAANSSDYLKVGDIDLRIGHPKFLAEFWKGAMCIPERKRSFYENTSYLNGADYQILSKQLYNLTSRCPSYSTGYPHVIVGHGATAILAAALWAHKQVYGKEFFLADVPHWSMFEGIANVAGSKPVYDGTENYTEIVTSPNNPDGTLSDKEGTHIADLSYCWPTYLNGDVPKQIDAAVYVFSLGKATGLVGLRLGWAMVKDLKLVTHMEKYLEYTTGGLSVQTVQSGINVSKFLNSNGEFEKLFEFGSDILKSRRVLLNEALSKHGIKDEAERGMFSFVPDSGNLFKPRGIIGISGSAFGVASGEKESLSLYTRLNIGTSNEDFEEMIERLK